MSEAAVVETVTIAAVPERVGLARAFVAAVLGESHPCNYHGIAEPVGAYQALPAVRRFVLGDDAGLGGRALVPGRAEAEEEDENPVWGDMPVPPLSLSLG
jgi:hypothetical protein